MKSLRQPHRFLPQLILARLSPLSPGALSFRVPFRLLSFGTLSLGSLFAGLVLSAEVQAEPTGNTAAPAAHTYPLPAPIHASLQTSTNPHILFEPPTTERVEHSRGGASRPTEVKCSHDESYSLPLTALLPKSGLGITTRSHPTLLVYLPSTSATQAHFTLRDADNNGLYQMHLPITSSNGVVSIVLPSESPELLVGETYQWSLALLCQSPQTDMPIAGGHIQRIEMSEATALSEAAFANQPLAVQAMAYGQAGVWHDMLSSVSQLQQVEPNNQQLKANWAEILQLESLGNLSNTPLLANSPLFSTPSMTQQDVTLSSD